MYNVTLSYRELSLILYRQYTYDPDPELLSLFKNFEVKESDEVCNGIKEYIIVTHSLCV